MILKIIGILAILIIVGIVAAVAIGIYLAGKRQ